MEGNALSLGLGQKLVPDPLGSLDSEAMFANLEGAADRLPPIYMSS